MPNQATLLQYHVVLDWAREIVRDIDRNVVKSGVTNDNGEGFDTMLSIREQQLRVIEILTDLVGDGDHRLRQQVNDSGTKCYTKP